MMLTESASIAGVARSCWEPDDSPSCQFVPGYLYHAADDIHIMLERFQALYDYAQSLSYLLLRQCRSDRTSLSASA